MHLQMQGTYSIFPLMYEIRTEDKASGWFIVKLTMINKCNVCLRHITRLPRVGKYGHYNCTSNQFYISQYITLIVI